MSSVSDIFVDGASEIGVAGGVVRINLVKISAVNKDSKGAGQREVSHQLLLTPQAATELHALLNNALQRMEQAGVVTKRETAEKTGKAKK